MKEYIKELIEISSQIKYLTMISDYSQLPALIEKYQTLGNRLEASLSDKKDAAEYREERSKLAKEVDGLTKKKKELKPEDQSS